MKSNCWSNIYIHTYIYIERIIKIVHFIFEHKNTSKFDYIKHTPHRIDIDHVETNYALRQQMDLKFKFGALDSQACISSKTTFIGQNDFHYQTSPYKMLVGYAK